MKQIKLTQGKVALVDDADYDWLNQWNWYAKRPWYGGHFYAARGPRKNGKRTTVYMHRLITNCPRDYEVDHINADTLDNRRANLEIVTKKQNLDRRMYGRKDSA